MTLALASAALGVHAVPAVADLLVYERAAVEAGQAWRLLGAHWVHFSTSHLLASAGSLALFGCAVEQRGGSAAALCLGAALGVGLAVHLLAPQVRVYAGLSGIACAALGWLVVDLAGGSRRERVLALLAALALAAKVGLEWLTGEAAFGRAPDGVAPLPLAHAAGAALGAAFGFVRSSEPRRREKDLPLESGEDPTGAMPRRR